MWQMMSSRVLPRLILRKAGRLLLLVQLDSGQQAACIELQRVLYRSMCSVFMLIPSFKVFIWAIIDLYWGESVGVL